MQRLQASFRPMFSLRTRRSWRHSGHGSSMYSVTGRALSWHEDSKGSTMGNQRLQFTGTRCRPTISSSWQNPQNARLASSRPLFLPLSPKGRGEEIASPEKLAAPPAAYQKSVRSALDTRDQSRTIQLLRLDLSIKRQGDREDCTLESPCTSNGCGGCTERFACHCLGVTTEEVVQAVTTLGLRTLDELRQHTGAGEGCTACHFRLRRLLHLHAQSSSSSPICSVR